MYLKGTLHMKLNITVDSLSTIRWNVDASYGVYSDCKGRTGMMMTLGAGTSSSYFLPNAYVSPMRMTGAR